jgi:hypothetical protein
VRLVHVAHRADFGIRLLDGVAQIPLALPPRADEGDDDAIVRASDSLVAAPAEGHRDSAGD